MIMNKLHAWYNHQMNAYGLSSFFLLPIISYDNSLSLFYFAVYVSSPSQLNERERLRGAGGSVSYFDRSIPQTLLLCSERALLIRPQTIFSSCSIQFLCACEIEKFLRV